MPEALSLSPRGSGSQGLQAPKTASSLFLSSLTFLPILRPLLIVLHVTPLSVGGRKVCGYMLCHLVLVAEFGRSLICVSQELGSSDGP